MHPLARNRLNYIASPYTLYRDGPGIARIHASALCGKLMRERIKFFCPIMHGHPMSEFGGADPFDHSLWLPFNQPLLEACDVLVVAQLPGWRESRGVRHEIDWFANAVRPIVYLSPETLAVADIPIEPTSQVFEFRHLTNV